MDITLNDLITVILLLIIVIQNKWIRDMIPAKYANVLIGKLEPYVEKTPNKLDDLGLDIAKRLSNLLQDTPIETGKTPEN